MSAAQKSLRIARIFHIALLAASIAYIALPLLADFGIKQKLEPIFPLALGCDVRGHPWGGHLYAQK
jgi:hypothetical protein